MNGLLILAVSRYDCQIVCLYKLKKICYDIDTWELLPKQNV